MIKSKFLLILMFCSAINYLIFSHEVHRQSLLENIIQKISGIDNKSATIDVKTTDPQINKTMHEKEYSFMTFMAADNDLGPFARKNLREQSNAGSTQYINIITQLDTRVAGNKKVTKRYYVEKDKLLVINHNDPTTQQMDSGVPNTLIDFCKWGIHNFPAKKYVLNLWNHGTGALDIGPKRTINPFPLFLFNPENNLIELDRSIPFFDFIQSCAYADQRAICFDDTTGHYLTNQDLEYALDSICTNLLNGKKLTIICFDACLMSMIEIANIVKNYAEYMVASQEVELGTGYNYYKILTPFSSHSPDKEAFARHIVYSYEQAYTNITNDFTQSALDLKFINALEQNINQVSMLLIDSIKFQQGKSIVDTIKASRHKLFCTHFDEPSYIDLHHFYNNLLTNLKRFNYKNGRHGEAIRQQLNAALLQGIDLIKKTVIANVTGKNLARANGISIYFPERRIHSSYHRTNFAKTNAWPQFLKDYLAHYA
ncbi:MAG: clostripain-related cysteine peptidase [Candidatus Babeliales bacterium]